MTLLKRYVPILLIFSLVFIATLAYSEEQQIPTLSVEVNAMPLKDFIDIISKDSGYKIIISEDLLTTQVSGKFSNVNLEQLFHKILRKHNVFQIIDTGKKELLLFTDLRKTKNVYAAHPDSPQDNPIQRFNYNDLEVRPGVTLGEVRQQRETLAQKMNNNEITVDGDGGPTYTESKDIRKQTENDISTGTIKVDLGDGRTLDDLQASREELEKQIQTNEIQMVADDGVTLKKSRALRAELEQKIRSKELVITEDNN